MPRRGTAPAGRLTQGTLDLLVLKTLVLGPAHGHTIAHAIARRSEDVLQAETDRYIRLSTALRIAAGSGRSGHIRKQSPRPLLPPLAKGRAQLAEQTTRWDEIVRAINRILRPATE